jgi:hypothetical protein
MWPSPILKSLYLMQRGKIPRTANMLLKEENKVRELAKHHNYHKYSLMKRVWYW